MKKIIKSGIFKTFVIITCLFMSLSSLMIGLNFCGVLEWQSGDAFDTSEYRNIIGEIWDSSNQRFNKDTFDTLLKAISGQQATSSNMQKINEMTENDNVATSSTFRSNYGSDIVVTVGGLKWTPTYLSRDIDNNIILTLWLSDSYQIERQTYTPGEILLSGGTCGWTYGFDGYDASKTEENPDNMYGTSYIRCVVLNNGGYYKGSPSDELWQSSPSYYSVFRKFTYDALTKYIVSPSHVAWQRNQSAMIEFSGLYCPYNLPNEGLTTRSGFFSTSYNYTDRDHYADWGNDYLWLPSWTEAGNISDVILGIWETSVEQRRNKINDADSWLYTWLRSGAPDNAANAYCLDPSGTSSTTDNVYSYYAVRPAFHLNLSAAAAQVAAIGELWDSSSSKFDENNINTLLRTISGSRSASVDNMGQINDLAENNTEAITMQNNNNEIKIIVTLGGLTWTPTYLSKDKNGNTILTLWLDNPSQLSGKKYDYINSFETYIFGSSGEAYWLLQGTDSTLDTYPSNMYGTSYMSSVVLNNGGIYLFINREIDDYTPSSDSVFAPFTIGDLTQFIVTPQEVSWQVSGQSAITRWGETYNYPNEDLTTSTGFYEDRGPSLPGFPPGKIYESLNYTNKGGYTDWGNDYLWLPSATEIGWLRDESKAGIWKVTYLQRKDLNDSWLRSGGDGEDAYSVSLLASSGAYIDTGADLADGGGTLINTYSVRPAFHLNLTAISESLSGYDITFDGNGGRVNGQTSINHTGHVYRKNEELIVYADQDSSFDSATTLYMYREGHKFLGFTTSSSSPSTTNKLYEVTDKTFTIPDLGNGGRLTLYAQWQKESYYVTFDGNGGTINGYEKYPTSSTLYSYGDTLTIYKDKSTNGSKNVLHLYKKGYNFTSFDQGSISGTTYTIPDLGKTGQAYTIKANWTPRQYTIKFDAGGKTLKGSLPASQTNKLYTGSITMPKVESLGYLFAGWYAKDSSGKTYKYNQEVSIKDITLNQEDSDSITLYAQWQDTWANHYSEPNPGSDIKEISKPEHLGWLAYELQKGTKTFAGIKFIQTRNINLYNYPWLSEGVFKGSYDGNGFYITNLKTTDNANVVLSDYEGLFAQTDGTENPVQLTNINIMSGNLKGGYYVGSIVGKATNTIIRNCRNSASVSGNNYVGGIVGQKKEMASTNASATVTNCINYGKVDGSSAVGGLFGDISNSTIDACYVRANVNGSSNTGGLIGTGTSVTIKNSAYVENTTTPSSVNWVAGLMTGGEVCDCLIKTSGAEISFPSNATNCVGYVNNGSPKTQPMGTMNFANWTTINGQYYPKALTWTA